MIKINSLSVEYKEFDVITDNKNPIIYFNYIQENNCDFLNKATLLINNHEIDVTNKVFYKYEFNDLKELSTYELKLKIISNDNLIDEKTIVFSTGLMNKGFNGEWISDPTYIFKEKKVSPKPLLFLKTLNLRKKLVSARLFITSIGIYKVKINDKLVGEDYFAPGFTSYKHNLQYQVYDCLNFLNVDQNDIKVIVAGGWAVGSFGFTRKNRISAKKQALLCDLHLEFEDGTKEIISSDETWKVSHITPFIEADLYDGEVFDGRFENKYKFNFAKKENIGLNPKLRATYGSLVKEHEVLKPTLINQIGNKYIFDFGQNFAGIINIKVKNADGNEEILIKHAEILNKSKDLNTAFLRSAKARIIYYPPKGDSTYQPTFTYMGFGYISLEGIDISKVEIKGIALYSDIKPIGDFKCSNPLINRLQKNIIWSLKSNFMDIPTDCPQRDERMGWTGDINVFISTALYNFECTRFIDKWLQDLKVEQKRSGGIPNTIPSQGFGFPETMPTVACEFWGDAVINVPYNLYLVTENIDFLNNYYPSMEKYFKACRWWANFLSFGENKYIWKSINLIHFGDWVAPDIDKMSSWQARHPYTATASLKVSASSLANISKILLNEDKEKYYLDYSKHVSKAFEDILLDNNGKISKNTEFQTGYVLPLYFDMLSNKKDKVIDNLVNLIKKNDYKIYTGFPGTPYILFSLFDYNHQEDAIKMLLNEKCPSWLYEVKVGGTTIWGRWNVLDENGECSIKEDGTGGIISYNHYASGAVGAFLYQRIAGIEPIVPGYKYFRIKPFYSKYFTNIDTYTVSIYGKISLKYQIENNKIDIEIEVPFLSKCEFYLPNGEVKILEGGKYHFLENVNL